MKARVDWAVACVLVLQACEADGAETRSSRDAIEEDAAIDEDAASGTDTSTQGDDATLPEADAYVPAPQPADAAVSDAAGSEGVERDVLRPTSIEPTAERVAALKLPAGFKLAVFARELEHARMLAVHHEHVYLTRPNQGDVLRLVDADGDGVAEERKTVVADLPGIHGIAIREPNVFLATPTHVYRATLLPNGDLGTATAIIDDLPAGGQHPNRTLAIGADDKLYITVGSPCDACPIDNPEYATVLRAEIDGSRREIFASGLRNTLGFGWHPVTGELWGMDHGSDWRGDDIPPEELNRIEQGKDYGWPYCYGQRVIDPVIQDPVDSTKQAYCANTAVPVLENQAHQAPIAFSFYTATQFPESYRNSAFVAFRGSWNRIPATGYKVARVVFEGGQPTRIEDFVTGFLAESGTEQLGRLAGLAVDEQGALLFSDDENGVIYRVTYAP